MNDCFESIRQLNIESLEEYLKTGNINVKDETGKSLLIYAVIYNFEEAFDLLIKNYININAKDDAGNTALMYAITYSRIGYFKRLVRENADINIVNNKGESPIMVALGKKRDQMAKILFDAGADLSVKNENEENIYFSVVKSHDLELLERLLDGHEEYVFSKNYTKRGLLHQAVMISDIKITKFLLEKGALPNEADNFGETPIYFAIRNKDYDAIALLMDYGALLEGRNHFYETPLETAPEEIREYLTFMMNKVKYTKYIKKYPLHVAVQTNDFLKVKQHANFYNMTKKDERGFAPLDYAKKLDFVEIRNYLEQQLKNYRVS